MTHSNPTPLKFYTLSILHPKQTPDATFLAYCISVCIISISPVNVRMSFERCECRFASLQADNLLLTCISIGSPVLSNFWDSIASPEFVFFCPCFHLWRIGGKNYSIIKIWRMEKEFRTVASQATIRPRISISTPNLYSIHNNSYSRPNKAGGSSEQQV